MAFIDTLLAIVIMGGFFLFLWSRISQKAKGMKPVSMGEIVENLTGSNTPTIKQRLTPEQDNYAKWKTPMS